jgi:hypothetical protein
MGRKRAEIPIESEDVLTAENTKDTKSWIFDRMDKIYRINH